jgi:hypothetical protein
VIVPPDLESPPFNNFFLWYAILHCVGAVAMFAAFTAAGALMVAIGVVDLAIIERRAVEIQLLWTAVSALFAIALAFIVGWHHGINFRQGFLGFFGGSFLSWFGRLPLIVGSWVVAGSFPYLQNLPAVVAMILAYAFVLTVIIWRKRRHSLNRRRRAALIEPFT